MKNFSIPAIILLGLSISGNLFSQGRTSSTVIIPASDFLDEIPKGNIITDASTLHTDWLFNNTGIVLNSATNLMTQAEVPEDGTYYLYVRSHFPKSGSFKVAINDKVTDSAFGVRT